MHSFSTLDRKSVSIACLCYFLDIYEISPIETKARNWKSMKSVS